MRRMQSNLDIRPSLCGSIAGASKTACGAAIDTLGFNDCLAIMMIGGIAGTAGVYSNLAVKFQECATASGTGAAWTDITNEGAVGGSFDFDTVEVYALTNPFMYAAKKYAKLSDGVRLRYIRAHATLTGTVGCAPKIAVGLMLGSPIETLYMKSSDNPIAMGTGNSDFWTGY